MYISGTPGLGKTACLVKVSNSLKDDLDIYYINCLNLKKSTQFYSQLWLNMTNFRPKGDDQATQYL